MGKLHGAAEGTGGRPIDSDRLRQWSIRNQDARSTRRVAANRVLATIALTLAEEFGNEFNDLGSMTINRPDQALGIEPDSCFYIQNAQAGQGLGEAISTDLPPDLALEVDIANKSDSKLKIYGAMGVPEVWLYQREVVKIKWLEDGEYVDSLTSRAFPTIDAEHLNQWLQLRRTGTDLTVVRAVRQFCREHVPLMSDRSY